MTRALLFIIMMMVPFSSFANGVSCPGKLKTPQAILMNTPSKPGTKPVTYSDLQDVKRIVRNIYEYNLRRDFKIMLDFPREYITDVIVFRTDNMYGKYIIMLVSNGCVLNSFYAPPHYRNAVIGLDL